MAKFNIRKSFQQKKFRYGGYAALLTMIVFAVVVAVNLVVGQLNLKLDFSANKMYSLSEQSIKTASELKNNVKIIGLYSAGNEDPTVKEILQKYTAKSNKITVEYVDPDLHPEFTSKYTKPGETISANGLIVESGDKFKVIDPSDMVNVSQDGQTVESVAIEQRITGAIMFVSSSKNPTIYSLQGHNEEAIPGEITKTLENENYILKDLELAKSEWKPESGDILAITAPQRDISTDELTKLKDYFAKGGRGIFFIDILRIELANLKQLLNTYGVNLPNTLILEADTNYTLSGNKAYLLPNRNSHSILDSLISGKLPVIVVGAQPIETLKVKKDTITVEPLLNTSNKAFAKINLDSKSSEKEATDIAGPFNVAVAITDKVDQTDETKNAKIVLVSSSIVLDPQLITASNQGNLDMVMNSVSWLAEKTDNLSIRPKELTTEILTINASQQLVVAGIAVILIPLLIAICGVSVWLRRRHL